MFVQLIQGRAGDTGQLQASLDEWMREQAPAAEGWLGTTAGVTGDGRMVAVVRFASAEAARRNSERPEQGRWWSETEPHVTDARFHDYPDAEYLLGGGTDDAGFVQVVEGRTGESDRALELLRGFEPWLAQDRPEIIGGLSAWDGEGNLLQTYYFTSEAEARDGEGRMRTAPEPFRSGYDEYLRLVTDLDYLDLAEPWLWSPATRPSSSSR